MKVDASASARDNILFLLKTRGALSAGDIAEELGFTSVAARQHLAKLKGAGEVVSEAVRQPVGRPVKMWRLTEGASRHFPDGHAELAVGLLQALRASLGEPGVRALLDARTAQQREAYTTRLDAASESAAPEDVLSARVAELCAIRFEEGYMAEVQPLPEGAFLLIENHCPICDAARACQNLCANELTLFREVLGPAARVERTEHVLARAGDPTGSRRCAYRVSPSSC